MTSSKNPCYSSLKIFRRSDGYSIPPFQDTIEFEFDPEVNLFIGVNGTGKSTILKLMARSFPRGFIPGYDPDAVNIDVALWRRTPTGAPEWDDVPQIYFPPIREAMPISLQDESPVYQPPGPDTWNEWRGLLFDAANYFEGRRVYHAMQKLYQEDISRSPRRVRAAGVAYKAFGCVKDISREMVRGDYPPTITTSERVEDRRREYPGMPEGLLTQPVSHYAMGIQTAETGEPIYIGALSTGTQSVLLWIWFLAIKLAHHYDFSEGWSDKPGVVFIDEIENHLHPTWQRRVIPALRKHFPNVQIFATTHSPFVVAGLKHGQVHRLYREGGVIKTTKPTDEEKEQRVAGWTVEDILSEFMEVDDPTDEETAEAAATLRWLRDQLPSEGSAEAWKKEKIAQLTDSSEKTRDEIAALHWLQNQGALQGSAIEWWEGSISQLRSMVSRDLEEGGPIAAQRALFLEQLSELLSEDKSQGKDDSDDSEEG